MLFFLTSIMYFLYNTSIGLILSLEKLVYSLTCNSTIHVSIIAMGYLCLIFHVYFQIVSYYMNVYEFVWKLFRTIKWGDNKSYSSSVSKLVLSPQENFWFSLFEGGNSLYKNITVLKFTTFESFRIIMFVTSNTAI